MDFDDLREYVLGDDVKDLDWKATARSGRPLVKRFVATRQHAVMLVVDTGRSMSALADATSTKRDVAVFAAGVVAQLATRHGDLVGLLAAPAPPGTLGRSQRRLAPCTSRRAPAMSTSSASCARSTTRSTPAGLPSHLDVLLDYAARNLRRRMIVVVIADDIDLTDRHRALLRRLDAQHEVLYCCVGDVAMTDPALLGRDLHVVGVGAHVPDFFRRNERAPRRPRRDDAPARRGHACHARPAGDRRRPACPASPVWFPACSSSSNGTAAAGGDASHDGRQPADDVRPRRRQPLPTARPQRDVAGARHRRCRARRRPAGCGYSTPFRMRPPRRRRRGSP